MGAFQGREHHPRVLESRENAWIFTFTPPFLQPSTQARLREAQKHFAGFNAELAACNAEFDARADNLLQFLDRVTGPIIEFVDKLKILDESSDKESLIKEWYSLD